MRGLRLLLLAVMLVMAAFPIQAQDGQFCVQAFEDRDGDGQRDPGEPPITRGIGANLLNASGIVQQTALIDNAPTSAQGVICFLNLPDGQYTMTITSADYSATTLDNMTVDLDAETSTLTTLFEFGAQRLNDPLAALDAETAEGELDEATLERIIVAAIGALIVMVGTAFVGLILLAILRRGRMQRLRQQYGSSGPTDYRRATTTGSNPIIPPAADTGEYPRQ